jgi:hypothetical protein
MGTSINKERKVVPRTAARMLTVNSMGDVSAILLRAVDRSKKKKWI